MKSLFCKLIIFVIFTTGIFGMQKGIFSFNANGGTLLIDKSGDTYHINGGVTAGIEDDRWALLFEGAVGQVPGTVSYSNGPFGIKLEDIAYNYGAASFSYIFAPDFSVSLGLSVSSAQTQTSDLYLLFGELFVRAVGGASLTLNFPYDIFLNTQYYGADFSFLGEKNNSVGGGKLHFIDVNAGKKWSFAGREENCLHTINTAAGFVYSYLNGSVTVTTAEQNQFFLPFSYAYGDCDLYADFITLEADYNFKKGRLNAFVNTRVFIDAYAYVRYYFKGTYKKNLIYNGSIIRYKDEINFSNADTLISMKAGLDYTLGRSDSCNTKLLLNKSLVVPVITNKTRSLFSDAGGASKPSSSQIKRYAKTALLSGWTFGISMNF